MCCEFLFWGAGLQRSGGRFGAQSVGGVRLLLAMGLR